jgi:cytoskeleton protein RodZ
MSEKIIDAVDNKQLDELSEGMEMIGPGQILSEAREKASLTVEHIANRLNFKVKLVECIEQDIFNPKLPATYNRGYLRSYARLVNVDVSEVLSAYDMLDVAKVQRSEMQSFSNLTEKQAEHSRIMWLSYIIAAILFGLMIMWWLQEPKQGADENVANEEVVSVPASEVVNEAGSTEENNTEEESIELDDGSESIQIPSDIVEDTSEDVINQVSLDEDISNTDTLETQVSTSDEVVSENASNAAPVLAIEESIEENAAIDTAIFTFSGDCWVNIFDATGERIAWGVKKSGYIMTVIGQAPLKITLGKPELADIEFNGEAIDLSEFNAGNIAKFTLPLTL